MPECTKIAHRCSLAIFTADEGIARNSAARTIVTHFLRRRNRASCSLKKSCDCWGSGKIRRRSRRESCDFGALKLIPFLPFLFILSFSFFSPYLSSVLVFLHILEPKTKKPTTWRYVKHVFLGKIFSVALPAEPRGEKKLFFVQILGGEKLLKFGEKWAVKNV